MDKNKPRAKEIKTVLDAVAERKEQCSEYGGMVGVITKELGNSVGNGGGPFCTYEESGITFAYGVRNDHLGNQDSSYAEIRLSDRQAVFMTDMRGETTAYVPGEWETSFREIYARVNPETVEEKVKVPSLGRRELDELKLRFGLD